MGFLHYHGIGVKNSFGLAHRYFRTAAMQNNKIANFVCFCLEEQDEQKKYRYLGHGLMNEYAKSFGTLGFLIDTEKISELPQSIQQ
jgi:TPR repeat protein